MGNKKSVSLVLLAYKEEENLRVLLPKIRKTLDKLDTEYEIVVVDTDVPYDNTAEVCRDNDVRYVNQPGKGFADAFRMGIKEAKNDLFLIMDSDGSLEPDSIPDMYRTFIDNSCDVVIGSRYVKGGSTKNGTVSVLMSHTLNLVFRIALGIKAKDISIDYRMYDTQQLKSVTLTNENYDVLQEVLLKLRINKPDLKIEEIPIEFKQRVYGDSKRQLIPFMIGYVKSLFRLTAMRMKYEIFPKIKTPIKPILIIAGILTAVLGIVSIVSKR